jgi:hypothetical protein
MENDIFDSMMHLNHDLANVNNEDCQSQGIYIYVCVCVCLAMHSCGDQNEILTSLFFHVIDSAYCV